MKQIDISKIEEIKTEAKKYFECREFCCSESIFRAVKSGFDMSGTEEMSAIASGFCGGIGGTHGGTCGALTGGVMALGLAFGRKNAEVSHEGPARILSNALYNWFTYTHHTSICSELLKKYDAGSEARRHFCTSLVESVAEKTALLIAEQLSTVKIMDWKEFLNGARNYSFAGNIKVMPDFEMPQFSRKRNVWVYLPPDYETMPDKRYPVLYMQDGQNLFAPELSFSGEWGIDDTLEKYFYEGKCEGIIVVGVENGPNREEEYTPWRRVGDYTDFLVDTLKPFIDKTFRTKPEREFTGVAGSSYGGVASLFVGLTRQDVFSKIGGFSPSAWEWREKIGNEVFKEDDMRIHLSVGAIEIGDDAESIKVSDAFAQQVADIYVRLKNAGFAEDEVVLTIDEQGRHSEDTWRRHFADAVLWMFAEEEEAV